MKTRTCTRCKTEKPITEFYWLKRRGGEYLYHCKSCDRQRTRDARRGLREELLNHYSNKTLQCALCPENRIDVLDLDHINGGGIQHRAAFKTPQTFYLHLKKEGFPTGIRVLCRNCNWLEWIRRKEANYVR